MPVRLIRLFLALAMTVGVGALPAVETPTAAAGVTVTAVPAASGTLQPGQALVITATIRNGTASTVVGAVATASLDRAPMTSRAALAAWQSPEPGSADTAVGVQLGQQQLQELAPGQQRSLTFVIAADTIGLDSQAWGVHALSVLVSSAGSRLAKAGSSIVWYPGAAVQATRIAIVAPVTLPARSVGLIDASELATDTAPGGVLDRQLEQAVARRVAIAIDPMIIASIKILGTTAPPSATAWLDRLAAADNETFALGYADSDIAATTQAGSAAPAAPTSFVIDPSLFAPVSQEPPPTGTPTPTPTEAPIPPLPTSETLLDWHYTMTGISWPGDNTVVAKDLNSFNTHGSTTTILSSGNTGYGSLGYTPSASAKIGDHSVIISDATVSSLLRQAVTAPSDLDWQAAMTELSSAIAVLDQERSDGPRTVLATLGRGYPTASYRLTQTLDALAALPWAATARLADALGVAPVEATLTEKPEAAERVRMVTSMLDSESTVAAFSSVLDDPTVETGPRRLSLLAVLSHAWDADPTGWNTAAAQYLTDNNAITASVLVAESSTINLLADNGNLPITVSNALDHAVTVYVTVRPQRAILDVVDSRVRLKIEANAQARAFIPVQSVANGQVTLGVSLRSATGVLISQPTVVEINVQAGWETAVTVVIALLLVVVFGFGIWRNIAKRRKTTRGAGSDGSAAANTEDNAALADQDAKPETASE